MTEVMSAAIDEALWGRVRRYLGDQLVQHMLGMGREDPPNKMSVQQHEAASFLIKMFASSQLEAWNELLRFDDISRQVCSYRGNLGMSLASHLHYFCGGQKAVQTDIEDSVEAALCKLALDVYPLFLIGGQKDGTSHFVSTAISAHPERAATLVAMYRPDEPLMKLFPDADFAEDPVSAYHIVSQIIWSNGQGGTVQFTGLPDAILMHAPGALRAAHSAQNSYVQSVRETLKAARRLAEGKATKVPAIVGCYGLSLADDVLEVPLQGARFRRKTAVDHSLISESPHETIILEIEVSLQATAPAEQDPQKWDAMKLPSGAEFKADLQNSVDKARLAVLLTSPSDEVRAVGQSFLSVPNPVSLSKSWSKSPMAWPRTSFQSRPLAREEVAEVQRWDEKLAYLPSVMSTGVRRLLSAVSERYDPEDSFIDAVIAWENMFGAATETSFRVTGALAWVLYPMDKTGRTEFLKKASKIYSDRSALVHGSDKKSITGQRAVELRNESVDIAIRAMRAVMDSEDLRGAKDSIERSKLALINIERSVA